MSFAILVKKLGLFEHRSKIDIDSVFIKEQIDTIPVFVEELLLHQRYIQSIDDTNDVSNNDKYKNELMKTRPPFYIALDVK